MQGKNINLDFRIIEFTENKGNKHIKLPMNNNLYNFFKGKNYNDDDYVFINLKTNAPYKLTAFRDEWIRIKNRAGIENLKFHDLGHTGGT